MEDDRDNPDVMHTTSTLSKKDLLGAFKARWGVRDNYKVEPGLYALGKPGCESPVFVSANYKLTFDALRKNLGGINCWILILDTKGINVWCAAGKGTFGTDELVERVWAAGLSGRVTHRALILPQLGATGVSAHEVKRRTGFDVFYGPVRARDIKAYLASGYKASKEMRTVSFNLADRVVLIPMELVPAVKIAAPAALAMLAANLIISKPFDKRDFAALAGSVFAGSVMVPVLLPLIPGRAFAWKGWLAGLVCTTWANGVSKGFEKGNRLLSAGRLLLFPAVSSYLAMNFTGATTYTSPSGVRKEMRKALPFITVAAAAGLAITLGAHLTKRRG